MYIEGDVLRDALRRVLALPPDERLSQVANVLAAIAEERRSRLDEEEDF